MASRTAVIAWYNVCNFLLLSHFTLITIFIIYIYVFRGSGEDGQLGIGNNEEKEWVCTIKALKYSEKVSSIVAGSRNSLAICEDGKVCSFFTLSLSIIPFYCFFMCDFGYVGVLNKQLFTWGWNQRGTLGHPPETKTENIPSQVKALSNVKIVQVILQSQLSILFVQKNLSLLV